VVAVLATGRPEQDGLPARVRQLLAGKGLHFDEVHLKPEADLSTTGWKQELLGELVERHPVSQVEIWEDRHLGELVDFIREALRLPVVPHHVWGHPHPCMTLVEPTSDPPGTRIYYEAILAPPSRLLLWKWWEKCVGPLLEKGLAHHVTLSFIRDHGERDWPIGSTARYRVVGWAQDDEIQAVAVEPVGRAPMPLPQIPHVTVATAPGVPAVKSNALLARGFKRVRGPTLDTVIGYCDGAHRVSAPPRGRRARKRLPQVADFYQGLHRRNDGIFYRGTLPKGAKGPGIGALGAGTYFAWEPGIAEFFSKAIIDPRTGKTRMVKGGKVESYRLPLDLQLLDAQSQIMAEIKAEMGFKPWEYAGGPMFANIIRYRVEDLGYDGVVSSKQAEGLVLFDVSKATLV
jgi:hypothetical protein